MGKLIKMSMMNNYDPQSPASNADRAWEKDEQGRWKYVGLTFSESEALMKWNGISLVGDDIDYSARSKRVSVTDEHRKQMLELWYVHEKYRQKLVDAAQIR